MKQKILILPSWYISPNDRINGSFFQAQGRLVSDEFETKVIYLKLKRRPSLRKLFESPVASGREWFDYLVFKSGEIDLPDEDEFNIPKLNYIEKKASVFSFLTYQEQIIRQWVSYIGRMIGSGWRPDLIRAHTVFPAGVVARRIKEIYGIPYIISEHLPFSILNFKEAMRPEIKSAFEQSDLVLSLGYDKVRQIAMSDIDIEPNIIFNMVDDDLFNGLAVGYSPKNPLRLITVGAASFYKDHKTLLRAFKLVIEQGINAKLTMVGLNVWGRDKLSETQRLIVDLDLEEYVMIIDKLSRQEVSQVLPNHDVFLMTSIQEGFPNAVLEALASGLFVVATRHGGTEDLITDQVGRIVPIKSPDVISDVLCRIYSGEISFDPNVIRRFAISTCGKNAYRERIIKNYRSVIGK